MVFDFIREPCFGNGYKVTIPLPLGTYVPSLKVAHQRRARFVEYYWTFTVVLTAVPFASVIVMVARPAPTPIAVKVVADWVTVATFTLLLTTVCGEARPLIV